MDHATIARHIRTDSPMSPRAPPTAMKTVPSGRLDCCMYGALEVGGTVAVGMFVRVLDVDVIDGRAVPVDVVPVFVPVVVVEDVDVEVVDVEVSVAVLSLGRPVSVPVAP